MAKGWPGDSGSPEAKTHLPRLLEAVENDEEIGIARAGRPVARLVPDAGQRFTRQSGSWRGPIVVAADVDVTPPHVISAFHDGDMDPAVS